MFYAGCSCIRLNLAASKAFWNHCTTIIGQVSLSNLPFLLIKTYLRSSTPLQWVVLFRRWADQDQVLHSKSNSSCIIRKKPETSTNMPPLNLLFSFQQCTNPPTCSLPPCSALLWGLQATGVVWQLFQQESLVRTCSIPVLQWDSSPSCVLFEVMPKLFCSRITASTIPISHLSHCNMVCCCICFQPSHSLFQTNNNGTHAVFPHKGRRGTGPGGRKLAFYHKSTLFPSLPSHSQQQPLLSTLRCQSRALSAIRSRAIC